MKTLLFTLLIASAAFSQIEPKIDNAQEKVKDTAYVLFDDKNKIKWKGKLRKYH